MSQTVNCNGAKVCLFVIFKLIWSFTYFNQVANKSQFYGDRSDMYPMNTVSSQSFVVGKQSVLPGQNIDI